MTSDHHHPFQINFKHSYQPWTRENSMAVVGVRDSQPLKPMKWGDFLKLNRKYFLLSRLTHKAIYNSWQKLCRIREASHECRAFGQGLLASEWKKGKMWINGREDAVSAGITEQVASPELSNTNRERRLFDVTQMERGNFYHGCSSLSKLLIQEAVLCKDWSSTGWALAQDEKLLISQLGESCAAGQKEAQSWCENPELEGGRQLDTAHLSQLQKSSSSLAFRSGRASFWNHDPYLETLLLC